ncbi:MAG: exodeoxyribonuclease III [Oscillospiraceae bacterium]|nr:exodeoxyribonuclease III [Oscillospiraceae bacterium]
MTKLISWNVNGFRSCLSKGFETYFKEFNADIFCIQETKMQPEQVTTSFDGYQQYFNSAVKKGYSGTAVFSKQSPARVTFNFDGHTDEGRAIIAEYDAFRLVNLYVPNAQRGLTRIDYRMQWEDDLRAFLTELDKDKPVILCGDLNVAHKEIDLKNAKANVGNAGFSDQERGKFGELLAAGFTDTFRFLHPTQRDAYSWWSYMGRAREKNVGWRIDYFLVSDRIADKIRSADIFPNVYGSDHCPVGLEIDL